MPLSTNGLLGALPPTVFEALQPHLKPVNMTFAQIISDTGQPIHQVLFPHDGVVSLVVEMDVGDFVETAMIGRDGVVNGASALDGKMSLHKAIVQVAGTASAIDADTLRKFARQFDALTSIILRHEQVLLAQAQQSAGCNASHDIEARMCRWIMRLIDLTRADELKLTQEFLAQMLGVRRSSVSMAAGQLQRAGWIKYRRGTIEIVDVEGLKSGACECYERVRSHYNHLTPQI